MLTPPPCRGDSDRPAPPWSALRARRRHSSRSRSRPSARCSSTARSAATGRGSAFDQPESAVRVTLYRDDAAVPLLPENLARARGIAHSSPRLGSAARRGYKPGWFSRLVDGGKLPAIELDGALHVESDEIIDSSTRRLPTAACRFVPAAGTDAARRWRICSRCSSRSSPRGSRSSSAGRGREARRGATACTTRCVLSMLSSLWADRRQPWFLAPSPSSTQYIVSVERLLASVLYWKGMQLRCTGEHAHFERWLAAFEARPSYIATKSDYYTHAQALPSQNGPGYAVPEAAAVAARIGGLGGAWSLEALSRHDDVDEPLSPLQTAGGADAARHEAALASRPTTRTSSARARGGASPAARPSRGARRTRMRSRMRSCSRPSTWRSVT